MADLPSLQVKHCPVVGLNTLQFGPTNTQTPSIRAWFD